MLILLGGEQGANKCKNGMRFKGIIKFVMKCKENEVNIAFLAS